MPKYRRAKFDRISAFVRRATEKPFNELLSRLLSLKEIIFLKILSQTQFMKKLFFTAFALLTLTFSVSAQLYPPTLRGILTQLPPNAQKAITDQYRKPNKEERETLQVSAADKEKYVAFLRQPDTGLVKLAADFKCADNTKVVVATPDCLKYTMPGAGSSYSFRTENYRIQRLADLTFTDNGFLVTGALTHGILARIGDVPLEKVSLQTEGLKYLVDFKPVTDYAEAQKIAAELVKGITRDGFLYRRGLNANDNTTYVLRVVAYNGRLNRAVQGIAYNEFDFDKRNDVIVAFRIVSRDADGGATILWKKLAEKDAPRLIQPKE